MVMKIDPTLSWLQAHEIMVTAIAPRPIAFVSTVGPDGVFNLAPFSLVTPICMSPIILGLSIGRREGNKKDTLVNIEASGEYVVNTVTEELAAAMNQASASYPGEVDEFAEVGLTPVPCELVRAPRVGEAAISFECRLKQILEFGPPSRCNNFVIGEVVMIHVRDEFYGNDEIQAERLKLIGRLGGNRFCRTTDGFEMERPNKLK
jgi:flavin reductase (DIM6/NTAB) family NADH-FMN oxidoreductase RutF